MGRRGPPPKPNEERLLEGNPGKRPIIQQVDEEDLSSGSLRMPTRMVEEERRVWRDTLAAFPNWYFTLADKYLLVAFCRAVARVEKSEKALQNKASIEKRANGSLCLSPHIAIINEGNAQILRLSEALGLTRRARRGTLPIQPPLQAGVGEESFEPDGDGPEFGDLMAPPLGEQNE